MQVIFTKTVELSYNGSATRIYDAGSVHSAKHPQEVTAFKLALEAGDAKMYDPAVYDRPMPQENKVQAPKVLKMKV